VKINKTSCSISAQDSRQATKQIEPTRKSPVATRKQIGDHPTQMNTKADQDQYRQDDRERHLPRAGVRILPA
jgi:hypothetical protein